MFRRLRVNSPPGKKVAKPVDISIPQLIWDASFPGTIKTLNSLPDNFKLRLYRTLIPIQVQADFAINPRTWKNPDKLNQVKLDADKGENKVSLSACHL